MSEADKILLAELLKNPVDGNCYLPFAYIGLGKNLTPEMHKANADAIERKQSELKARQELIDKLTRNIAKDNATRGTDV